MTPNEETINPQVENRFDLIISGQLCDGYRFRVFDLQNNFISAASSSTKMPTKKIFSIQNINISQDMFTINSNELQNGDAIQFLAGTVLPTPLVANRNYYVGNFTFGRFNIFNNKADINDKSKIINITDVGSGGTHTISFETPLYNGEKLSIMLDKNKLQAGNDYKWAVELFAEEIRCSISPSSKTISSVSTESDTLTVSSMSGITAGSSINFKATSQAEMPEPLQMNTTYFVGSISGSTFKLFNYRDDALTGTSPIDITKAGTGTLTAYINATSFTATNHNLTTGDTVYVFGSNPSPLQQYTKYYVRKLDNDHIALFNYIEGARNDAGRIGIMSTGSYSFTVSNVAESEQIPFSAYDDPIVTFKTETITQQSHVFKPIYEHPQGVMVVSFRALMRSIGTAELDIDSGLQENTRLEYEFDGLLNGNIYAVKFIINTKVNQTYETDWVQFPVEYPTPNLGVTPTATNHPENASVLVEWGGIKQVIGESNGDMEFVKDFALLGNHGLKLFPDAYLVYQNLDIKKGSSPPVFWWNPCSGDFTGKIMRAENSLTGAYIEIGYNGVNFYRVINGITFNNAPMTITSDYLYMIGVTASSLIVNVIGNA